ncbi:hypothetical protein Ddye_017613 [Dipteronia dyeriana]|uniref:CCHC-type domain-containing protein n=1 Tax=Dipteronia dyeriana TaxID=168575 RepID=A0AAD9U9J5_9ROSI|nr:hypothetical protein Ddye_017613 [Dipteronia dyeriana]
MFTLTALDKLCATQRVFTEMIKKGRKYDKNCKLPDSYHLKCISTDHCNCRPYRHSRRQPKKERVFPSNKKNRKYEYYQKKARRSWNKSNKCFACGQQGKYTKQCPNKRTKSAKLIQQLMQIVDDVPFDVDNRSIVFERDDVNPHTAFMIQDSDDSSLSPESSDYSEPDLFSEAYQATSGSNLSLGPQVQVQILIEKYSRPISAITYFNTGAHSTMINLRVLPLDAWKKRDNEFLAADDEDILIGWNVYSQSKFIRILPTGIRFKREFKPFSNIPKIFPLSAINSDFQQIQEKLLTFCTNSHADFRHPKSLWKNPDFFIRLPFNLNEDVNPTKASHSGMSPLDLLLANEECEELLRGKKRLVIDYKPLNLFLRDDKFLVPRANSLFSQLPGATVFSKFDLKGAF